MMLTESMEDYLEMIYRIFQEKGYVRPVDLAEALNVQPSSVTRMVQRLNEQGVINYEKYRNISLSERGLAIGNFLVWRDETLKQFLSLLMPPDTVAGQVEGIEHYVTPVTMCLFRDLIAFFRSNPSYIEALRKTRIDGTYPEGEKLGELRAWLFRHSTD